jgi:hypothetical protein
VAQPVIHSVVLAWLEGKFGPTVVQTLLTNGRVHTDKVQARLEVTDQDWLFRCQHPDVASAGREWLTDIRMARVGTVVTTTVRNGCAFEAHGPSEATVPRLVGALIDALPHLDGERPVRSQAWLAADDDALDDVLDDLEDRRRWLPMLLVTPYTDTSVMAVDAAELASRLGGAAHVVSLTNDMTYALTDEYGKQGSAFNGAIRCFWPGFQLTRSNTHTLFLPSKKMADNQAERSRGFMRYVLEQVLSRFGAAAEVQKLVREQLPELAA